MANLVSDDERSRRRAVHDDRVAGVAVRRNGSITDPEVGYGPDGRERPRDESEGNNRCKEGKGLHRAC